MPNYCGLHFFSPGESAGHASTRPPAVPTPGHQAGFTLMELMVTIAIIGILAAIAVPNAIAWRNNSQFNAAVRQVKSAMEGARMAAIRTNLQSSVTFNNTNLFTTQTQTIAAGAVDAGAAVNHRMLPGIKINSNFTGNQLAFNNRGMPVNGMGGAVTIQHANGLSMQITVSSVGSSRIQ